MSAKVVEVHPGIYEIFLPLPMRPTIVNVWLIDCHGAWALVDTGMNTPESYATLEDAFRQVGTRLEDLISADRYPSPRRPFRHFGTHQENQQRYGRAAPL